MAFVCELDKDDGTSSIHPLPNEIASLQIQQSKI
jgi:hypothetical protein